MIEIFAELCSARKQGIIVAKVLVHGVLGITKLAFEFQDVGFALVDVVGKLVFFLLTLFQSEFKKNNKDDC